MNNFVVGAPGWHFCISDNPKLENHRSQKVFSETIYHLRTKCKGFFLRKQQLILGLLTENMGWSDEFEVKQYFEWSQRLLTIKLVQNHQIALHHSKSFASPNTSLVVCAKFSVHKKWRKVRIFFLATVSHAKLWVQLNHLPFQNK